jgi:hypothetical protein
MRWGALLSTWIVAALLIAAHHTTVRHYLGRTGSLGVRDTAALPTPFRSTNLWGSADSHTWIRLALEMTEGGQARLRHTSIDNAPAGRPVEWSSLWLHVIAGAGRIRHAVTNEPLPIAMERGVTNLSSIVLILAVVLVSTAMVRRFGPMAAPLTGLGMVGSFHFYDGFVPTDVDHHGLLTLATLGVLTGVLFMGVGWWRPEAGRDLLPASPARVRRGAVLSAVSGAFGMWISAASTIPSIAVAGVAALMVGLWQAPSLSRSGAIFEPSAWRLWGRVGAALSVVFYCLEYAPNHLGMRLEVNNPLYALAWFGAGEIIAELSSWRAGIQTPLRAFQRLLLPLAAVLAAPVAILVGGESVFVLRDPFLVAVHARIIEFWPLLPRLKQAGLRMAALPLGVQLVPLLIGVAVVLVRPMRDRFMLWFMVLASLGLWSLAMWQNRWLSSSSAPTLLLMVLLVAWLTGRARARTQLIVAACVAAALYLPDSVKRVATLRAATRAQHPFRGDALQPLYRDIASAIRAAAPDADVVLLSSPNASTGIGYYGRFKTLGTFYWENLDGIRAAGTMLTATSEDEALALLRQHRVTHIAMLSEESFIDEFFAILHPNAPRPKVKDTFGAYLFLEVSDFPPWAQPMRYEVPADLQWLQVSVRLFKVPPANGAP